MARSNRRYTETFRQGAVDLVLSGQSMASVCRQLDIPDTTLQNWVYRQRQPEAARMPDPGMEAIDPKLYRAALKRIHELEEENAFLGKASAYFAQKGQG